MAGELILFPVRLYFRAARFAVRTGLHATEQAVTLAAQLIKAVTPDDSTEAHERQAHGGTAAAASPTIDAPRSRRARPHAPAPPPLSGEVAAPDAEPDMEPAAPEPDLAAPEPDLPAREADVRAPAAPPLREEPEHVSEEPTIVEAFAEPGAEDGAGAQVNIAEPWEGYAHMSAQDVIERLSDASLEELAAIELYESAHKQRETVIDAAARELRAKSGRGATTGESRKEQPDG